MTELRTRAEQLLALGAYKAWIDDEYKRLHADLGEDYQDLGIRDQVLKLPDGLRLGRITVGEPTVLVEVVDEDAMLDWLGHKWPDEMVEETRYSMRSSFWRVIQQASEKAGEGVDPRDGEKLPWIRVTTRPGVVRVSSSSDAKQRVKEIVRRNGLQLELDA